MKQIKGVKGISVKLNNMSVWKERATLAELGWVFNFQTHVYEKTFICLDTYHYEIEYIEEICPTVRFSIQVAV